MQAKKIKVASVIITHNRVSEAKAQMDIIKELWQPMFERVDIYHEFNGKESWYPKIYKEDNLYRHESMDHLTGANHMLNQGIKHVLEADKKYDFIVVTSADTWFFDPKKLKQILLKCKNKKYHLATSLWGFTSLGTEFFVITPDLAKKVFPIRFARIFNKYKLSRLTRTKLAIFEGIFTLKVIRILKNPKRIYLIPGRRAVWPKNRFYSAHFYASHHDPQKRRRDIGFKLRSQLGERIDNMPVLNTFLS